MELKCNILDKIMGEFYEHPQERFSVRAIAKKTIIPISTVQSYLKELKKQGLISQDNQSPESMLFKTKKINYHIEKIVKSGLLDYLTRELNPSCIILFGSIRKGDSNYESDIDIFVETVTKKELILEKFEKILKHKIQLFEEQDINKLPPRLLNNVINGIKMYGSFQIK